MAQTMAVSGGTTLDEHVDLLMAGDRHLIGWNGARWIVTGAVVDEAHGVLLRHNGERIVLGSPATTLTLGAEAAARARLAGECCYDHDAIVDRMRAGVSG